MLTHYVRSAFRYLSSNKISSLLNIVGLSVTFAIFILLGSYVTNEVSMGNNLPNNKQLYRLQPENGTSVSYKTLELLKNIPEVSDFTYLMTNWSMKQYFVLNNKTYDSGKILYASNDFFNVFQYKPVAGNLEHYIDNPNGIVITQSQARKIFGNQNPVGKNISFKTTSFSDFEYQIVAVIEDLPQNDMLKFSCIMPQKSLDRIDWFKKNKEHWGSCNFQTFVTLQQNTLAQTAEGKINTRFKSEAPDWLVEDSKNLSLKPFRNLYYSNSSENDILIQNSKNNILSMGILALIILLAGAINFINLSTAQKEKKRKIIAISRTNGAPKYVVNLQFFIESAILIFTSLLIAIALVAFTFPLFNHLSDQAFPYPFFLRFLFAKGYWVVPVALAVLCGGIIAGYFQSGKYHLLLKNNNSRKEYFRDALLVTQFMVSIILITGTLIIQKQNKYMLNRPAGYQKEGIVCIPMIGEQVKHTSAIRSELLKIKGINKIAFASEILGQQENTWGMSISNEGENKRVQYDVIQVDSSFFSLMGLKIIEGTGFNSFSDREKHHIFNQTALNEFGITDINKARVTSYSDAPGNIIGVVQDFNYQSLHVPIGPLAFVYRNPENLSYVYLRLSDLSSEGITSILKKAGGIWKQFAPDWPFEYYFLDQSLAKLYEKDQSFGRISFALTILAVFIACFGLLGITLFMVEAKIKEIGIRKVNGAKISEVMILLNKNFVKWVIIAFITATPIAYYAMHKWLENFAYKTTLSWWIFALAGLLALGIALLTVSRQSWRAATRNPVEALRYE